MKQVNLLCTTIGIEFVIYIVFNERKHSTYKKNHCDSICVTPCKYWILRNAPKVLLIVALVYKIFLMASSRKRESFSLHDKKKFDGFDAEMKRSGKVCIAKLAFSLGLKRTTLSSILKGRKKTEEYQSQGQSVKRKKSRKCRNQEINDSLLFWFRIKLSQEIPIDGFMLKEKALQFAKDLNTEGPLCRLR